MIKSPLRYPGGKSRAARRILEIVPEFKEYREPFLGGGSVFVHLKQRYPKREYWINDIYKNLYYFWLETRDNQSKLLERIWYWRNKFDIGKELHRYLLKNIDSFDIIDKAAAFFIFNRITFSGTTESGGFSNAAYEKRFTLSSIQRVDDLSTILSKVKITNCDYEKVLMASGEDVFIYLDPPYFSAEKSALYGKNGCYHKKFDHERFMRAVKNTNHKWLITYDNSEYIRDLFSFANIYEWNLTYGMRNVGNNSNQIGKEIFISNYQINLDNDQQLLCEFG